MFGIEGDFAWTNLESNWGISLGGLIPGAPSIFSAKSEMNWFSTIRGRTGIALDNTLLYLTAGVAFADIEHSGTTTLPGPNASFSSSDTRWGWTAGAGVEHMLTDRISIKTEALYTKFEDKSFGYNFAALAAPNTTLSMKAHDDLWAMRVGLNFKLGGERSTDYAPLK